MESLIGLNQGFHAFAVLNCTRVNRAVMRFVCHMNSLSMVCGQ
jgi:hypothetical protein